MDPMEILRIRGRLGVSQRKLAALLGVSPGTVGRWEMGDLEVAPHYERLLRSLDQAPDRRVQSAKWLKILGGAAAGAGVAAFLWLVFGKKDDEEEEK